MRGPAMSGFVGRLGNVVGRKLVGGGYVVSAYQPQVFNPSTPDQRVGRSAFSLLAEMAKRFGRNVLSGLRAGGRSGGGNWFSEFIRLNYAQVSWSEDNQVSYFNLPGMVLSDGAAPAGAGAVRIDHVDSKPVAIIVEASRNDVLVDADIVRTHFLAYVVDAKPKIFYTVTDGNATEASFDIADPAGGQSPYFSKLVYAFVWHEVRNSSNYRTTYGPNESGSGQQSGRVSNPTETTSDAGVEYTPSVYAGFATITDEP